MLLSRSLPPHFLLPAWGTRKLLRALQRAYSSTGPDPQLPSKPLPRTHTNRDTNTDHNNGARRILGRRSSRASLSKRLEKAELEDQGSQYGTKLAVRYHRGRNENPFAAEKAPAYGPVRRSVSSNFFDQKSNIRYHESVKGSDPAKRPLKSQSSSTSNEEAGKSKPTVGYNTSIDRLSQWGVWFEKTAPTIPSEVEEAVLESTPELRHEPTGPASSVLSDAAEKNQTGAQFRPIEPMKPTHIVEEPLKSAPKARPKRTKPPASLFEELFPEESDNTKESEKKIVEKLPAFEWDDAPKMDWNETVESLAEQRKNWFEMPTASKQTGLQIPEEVTRAVRSEVSVLVLSCASKTLEESDFFRLGSKGQHIEGWTSGIVKGTTQLTL